MTILRNYTYYRTGGTIDSFHTPESTSELATNRKELQKNSTPFFLLGAGSNSLVMDTHYHGAVISFHKLTSMEWKQHLLYAEAGVTNTQIAEYCLKNSLTGLEWMYCLPGQIGATTRMNAKCYGGEISSSTEKVITVTHQGEIKTYQDSKIFRGYKDTIFMTNQEAVAGVWLKVQPGKSQDIERKMMSYRRDREKKNQFKHPSCGCVFKNDYSIGVPSGMLLDRAGVRTMQQPNNILVNPKHANFLFNLGAPSEQILKFIFSMRQRVFDKFGVWLELEMEILGSLSLELRKEVETMHSHQPDQGALEPLRRAFQTSIRSYEDT